MLNSHQGEFAALFTAFCWTISALVFESASKKIGSIAVNFIRLFLALIIISIYTYFSRGLLLPTDASFQAWFWLILSGLIGLVLGDYFLFESYTIIGSRIAMLIMTLVPPLTAFLSWLFLDEILTLMNFLGMGLTLTGIALVIINKGNGQRFFKINFSPKGLLFAFFGAVGQALGLILSKVGMGNYDAFAASQIRIITGVIGFGLLISFWKKWTPVSSALKNNTGMLLVGLGSVFGPFLGISFSLYAVQHTHAGIASTIMAIVPVLLIPVAVIFLKQKVTLKEVLGAVISVLGVALFFA
ncbi:MAG: DMT family transporter [Bacteroidales bacterium]|nr:DMT family transporter [Bacteroidales bacterium]